MEYSSSQKSTIAEFLEIESRQDPIDFNSLEEKWFGFFDEYGDSDVEILVEYNRFRLRNQGKLKRKRPSILVGPINDAGFPNFHTFDLLKIADVVSLTTQKTNASTVDRLYYSIVNDSFTKIIDKLPQGFNPLCYWDSQAEHGHPQPLGLHESPFPTVASICHIFYSPAIKHLIEVFDYVLPISEVFDQFLETSKSKVLRIPFGLNWASMHHIIDSKNEAREIDVSVTFSDNDHGPYGTLRSAVLEKMFYFQKKYSGQYNIEIKSGLKKDAYERILSKSKISINLVGFHGPYNYRTCEIINSGALLFQSHVDSHGVFHNSSELLEEGKHFIQYDLLNLEEKLLYFLQNPQLIDRVSRAGRNKLENDLNYECLFYELFNQLESQKENTISKNDHPNSDQPNISKNFHSAAFLWEQLGKKDLRAIGAAELSRIIQPESDLKFFCNLLAILPELYKNFDFSYIKRLIQSKNEKLAEELQSDLGKMVIQVYSLYPENAAMCYNMISISMENNWIDKTQLPVLAKQAFNGVKWNDYDKSWLLRYPIKSGTKESNVLYEKFRIPLLMAKENFEIWEVYRDYLLDLATN